MRLLLSLLVVAGLLVLADVVAASYTESRLAEDLQQVQGLDEPPDVDIGGFPFLTQALAGRYREVSVEADGVDLEGGLRAESLDVVLRGAQVPVGDVLGGSVTRVPAERAEARVLLAFDDLEQAAAPEDASSLELSDGPNGRVRVEAVVTVLGRELTLVSDSEVSAEGDQLRITTGEISVEGDEDGAAQSVVDALGGGDLDLTVDVGELPLGLTLQDVQVAQEGVVVVATGEDVVLEQLA